MRMASSNLQTLRRKNFLKPPACWAQRHRNRPQPSTGGCVAALPADGRDAKRDLLELPARRQFLQIIAIPDTHASGSLILAQDLTRVRRLETVRRDFISNISHELRTPLASLKALTETSAKRRSFRPGSWSAFPRQDQRRSGCADADGSGIARPLAHRVGSGGIDARAACAEEFGHIRRRPHENAGRTCGIEIIRPM